MESLAISITKDVVIEVVKKTAPQVAGVALGTVVGHVIGTKIVNATNRHEIRKAQSILAATK